MINSVMKVAKNPLDSRPMVVSRSMHELTYLVDGKGNGMPAYGHILKGSNNLVIPYRIEKERVVIGCQRARGVHQR